MGVQVGHYIIAGVSLKWGTIDEGKREEFRVSNWERTKKKFNIISDGMSGQYEFAGRVLAHTCEDEQFFADAPIDLTLNDQDKLHIREDIEKELGLNLSLDQIKIYAVTHCS